MRGHLPEFIRGRSPSVYYDDKGDATEDYEAFIEGR
jgi:hypothetical protein